MDELEESVREAVQCYIDAGYADQPAIERSGSAGDASTDQAAARPKDPAGRFVKAISGRRLVRIANRTIS